MKSFFFCPSVRAVPVPNLPFSKPKFAQPVRTHVSISLGPSLSAGLDHRRALVQPVSVARYDGTVARSPRFPAIHLGHVLMEDCQLSDYLLCTCLLLLTPSCPYCSVIPDPIALRDVNNGKKKRLSYGLDPS
ncbi:hypothetical protein VTO42DRAFT_8209 [Malbranchea cinnamomea]